MRASRWAAAAMGLGLAGCAASSASTAPPATTTTTASTTALATTTAPEPAPAPARKPGGPALDWPTYHHDAARTGFAPGLPPAGVPRVAWHRRLDGAVYGQPLVTGGEVIVATENDSVYGLALSSGAIRWREHLGTPVPLASLPCGNIDPLGITGTGVYDPATGLVYFVAETTGFRHVLAGLSAATGRVRFTRNIPTPDGHPSFDQQRAALALDAGRVYVAFGGLAGDCGPYRGSIVGVPASGRGPAVSYRVPTAREGGMWAPGGPVIAPDGTLYMSVGNGAAVRPPYDGSDSVTALSPGLRRTGIFAPRTWAADNAGDLDLGSTTPALLPGGRLLTAGKRGTGYLLSASALRGVGSQLAQAPVCTAFGGMAVSGGVAYVPCEGGGMAAVSVTGGRVRVLWRGPASADGSPVLGGGAVWVADWDAGVLYELAPGSGRVRHQVSLGGPLPHFASPSLSGGLALTGTMTGVVAVRGV